MCNWATKYDNVLITLNFLSTGWAAVIANLEDIVSDFKKKFKSFQTCYHEFLGTRESKYEILKKWVK